MAPTCDVTVVVTVHERSAFLREALESALRQTRAPREIVVTDDSASHVIRAIAHSLGRREVRYRSNPRRLGAALNVRAAIEDAEGEFVTILNDDDVWEPAFLERLVRPLEERPSRVLAFSDHWVARADGEKDVAATDRNTAHYGRRGLHEGDLADPARFVLEHNGVPLAMAALFRRDALPLPELVGQVDWAYDLWISCLLAATGRPFYYVPERLTRWRVHPAMETARVAPDKSKSPVFIYASLLRSGRLAACHDLLIQRLQEAWRARGRERLWFGETAAARRCFRKGLRLGSDWRSLLGVAASFAPDAILRAAGLRARHFAAGRP